ITKSSSFHYSENGSLFFFPPKCIPWDSRNLKKPCKGHCLLLYLKNIKREQVFVQRCITVAGVRRRNPPNCHRWAPSISFGASLCSFPGRDQKPESISVVCLLTGFYPPAFYLQWKGGADVISSGVETTKASKQAGDKYLASSYLKLTAAQYEKYESFTCEVTHESKKISKTVSKSGSC
uniref:Ig-like domain-containing protein n=1 Tax=Naja naja TaxID=35670 RepID=A0A8C6VNT8_NAJNA